MICVLRGGCTSKLVCRRLTQPPLQQHPRNPWFVANRRLQTPAGTTLRRARRRACAFLCACHSFIIRHSVSVICSRGIEQHFEVEFDYEHEQEHEYVTHLRIMMRQFVA
jgi:hypothetical protein